MKHRWEHIVCALLTIAEGIAALLTLGYYWPGWVMGFLCWCSDRECRRSQGGVV